jgi:hypothetical protein
VDIQPIAVDISKLRFFLSLIVDEKVDDSKENRGIDSLPNLEFKFVCANSLIGLPSTLVGSYKKELQPKLFEAVNNITELKKLREEYLRCIGNEKKFIEKKFQEIQSEMFLNSLNWGGEESQTVKLSQWNPFSGESCAWFNPEWMFGIKDGFDIVIGNPPYVQLQKNGGKLANLYKNCGYQTFKRTSDIYTLFYENGIKTLLRGGYLCFITSNKWMRTSYGEILREFFCKFNPIFLVDLGPGIFESAIVDTNILIIQKAENSKKFKGITLSNSAKNQVLSEFINNHAITLPKISKDIWFIGNQAEQNLKEKIELIGKPLNEWDVNVFYGIKTGLNEAFIVDQAIYDRLVSEDPKSREILKPILRGRDIKRYHYKWERLYLISTFPTLHLDINDYSAIKKYLLSFGRERLEQSGKTLADGTRTRKKTNNKWFETQDTIAYLPEFGKEKVIWIELSDKPKFCIDKNLSYTLAGTFIMTGKNIKLLCSVLNNKVSEYYFDIICTSSGVGTNMWKKYKIETLPIPSITPKNQLIVSKIELLVDEILAEKKQNSDADTSEKECQIDQMVYQLYNLTDDEIKIVENFDSKK